MVSTLFPMLACTGALGCTVSDESSDQGDLTELSLVEWVDSRLGRPVPEDLASLLLAGLAKDPAQRPPSAEIFRKRLRECQLQPWTDVEARAWWSERSPDAFDRHPADATADRTADAVAKDLLRSRHSRRTA